MAIRECVAVGSGAKYVIVCVGVGGKETLVPFPTDRRAFEPTLALLRSAYGRAYPAVEWQGDERSRFGVDIEEAYGR